MRLEKALSNSKFINYLDNHQFLNCWEMLDDTDLEFFYNFLNAEGQGLFEGSTEIPEGFFDHCDWLQSIVIPDNIISIKNYAFIKCKNLTNVVIPKTLKSICYSFPYCSRLKNIQYLGSKKDWKGIIKYDHWNKSSGISKIICTDGEIKLK